MSAGGARRGRRDNGLDAAVYAVAGDVDPRVGEHLLDVLAAARIAAYLQPASDTNPVTRTTTMPARPTDRLFVDRDHLSTAREYLAKLAADGPALAAGTGGDPDVDAEWERIVAGFHAQVDPDARPWPAAEHIDPAPPADDPTRAATSPWPDATGTPQGPSAPGTPPGQPGARPGDGTAGLLGSPTDTPADSPRYGRRRTDRPVDDQPARAGDLATPEGAGGPTERRRRSRPTTPDEPSLLDALDTFGNDLPDDPSDDERYTPPPPPPLPRLSKYAVAGVLAIVGGFVLFLFPTLLPLDPNVVMLFGFTGILAGFVTLIWRLRPGDEEDDEDPEQGAVV